jgi:DNA-binding PadR family transcriptional regulator
VSIVVVGNAKLNPSAKLAVLGLVLERPSYGYELVARFDRAFGEQPWEWRVTPQAIYGALNDLERDGLIEPIAAHGERWADSAQRRHRQDFRVTGNGARAIREWLAEPMPSNPSREELLIRLHFGDASDEALRMLLRRHAEVCLEELERIAAAPAQTRVQRLVKEDRRLAVQARLSWIDFARVELRGPGDGRVQPVEP